MYDVIIIGAGVSGCAIARELSRYQLKTAVLEKAWDVCEGTSKANSGIVHAGYDAKPGTLKAKLNVEGSRLMRGLSKELDFPYRQNGSLVLCFDEKGREQLEELKARGEKNGVLSLQILERKEVLKLEPRAGEQVRAALYAPSGAVVCPFLLTVSLAENAAQNGVEFHFREEVQDIKRVDFGYHIYTKKGEFQTRLVINAAGVCADDIHNMVSRIRMKLVPRRGEYLLCDKEAGALIRHTLFQLPTRLGKGVLVTPTVHGNLLIGPTAEDIQDKEGTETTSEGLELVSRRAALSVENLPVKQVITSFAGLRAHMGECDYEEGDFVIGEAPDAPGFLDVAGIESPGLSCAPAIGIYVADLVKKLLKPSEKENFAAERKGIPSMALATDEERKKLIAKDPAYANVICRCEMITEGEIVEAIRRPVGATTTDGIKRRVRAGMGRCQSGFCNPKVVELLARELQIDESEVTKSGENSFYLLPEGGEQE